MAYGYYVPLVVQSGQVTGSVTDFVSYIDQTFASWKSVANGGKVINTDGSQPADWAIFADSALTTPLDFEIRIWDATSGRVRGWVQTNVATSTTVYIAYNDAGVTTYQGNTVNTWTGVGFVGVYAMDTLGISDWTDSLGANNLTNNVGALSFATKIINGASFTPALSAYARVLTGLVTAPPLTISAWLFPDLLNNVPLVATDYNGTNYNGFVIVLSSSNEVLFYTVDNSNFSAVATKSGTTTGAWQHVGGVTASTSSRYAYLNGVAGSQDTTSATPSSTPDSFTVGAASHDSVVDNFYDGFVDEVRVHNVARSADWMQAEYNSQNDNAAFWVLGSEVPVGGAATWPGYQSPFGWS